jgi:PilZ domain-containing protein
MWINVERRSFACICGRKSWHNPAPLKPPKIVYYCQRNGQRPPLSLFCNILIIKMPLIQNLLKNPSFMQCEQRANYTLDYHIPITDSAFRWFRSVFERRAKPRSHNKLTARVWAVDSEDQPFSLDCVLDNISASGLYLRLPRRMKFSAPISLAVRMPSGLVDGTFAAINGTVIRDQKEHDGHTGVAVKIIEHSFI